MSSSRLVRQAAVFALLMVPAVVSWAAPNETGQSRSSTVPVNAMSPASSSAEGSESAESVKVLDSKQRSDQSVRPENAAPHDAADHAQTPKKKGDRKKKCRSSDKKGCQPQHKNRAESAEDTGSPPSDVAPK